MSIQYSKMNTSHFSMDNLPLFFFIGNVLVPSAWSSLSIPSLARGLTVITFMARVSPEFLINLTVCSCVAFTTTSLLIWNAKLKDLISFHVNLSLELFTLQYYPFNWDSHTHPTVLWGSSILYQLCAYKLRFSICLELTFLNEWLRPTTLDLYTGPIHILKLY